MSSNKIAKPPTSPTDLPSRYEIRQLTSTHQSWAAAIVFHSNVFHSTVWPLVYPLKKTQRLHECMRNGEYLISHQISSGLSLGVFNTEYVFKRPESAATGGALYWDESDLEADAVTLLEQMDFPLVSVALSYDGFNALEMPRMMPLVNTLPLFGTLYGALDRLDKRDPASWKPKAPGEVLMRNATSTRADYEGQGLMKGLAHYLMHEAARKGFRGSQIETVHSAVRHVWLHPPGPSTAQLVSEFDTATYEEDDKDGKKFKPFEPAQQLCSKIYVFLNNHDNARPEPNGARQTARRQA